MTVSITLIVLALIYAAGIALGLLLAALLWFNRRGNHVANRWLAATVGSLALLTCGSLLEDTRLVLMYPHLGYVTDWLIFAVGPCMWMYVRRLTGNDRPNGWRLLAHFMPALAVLALLVPVYVMDANSKRAMLETDLAQTGSDNLLLMIAAGQVFAYWVAALTVLVRYGATLRAEYSSIERLSFRWLRTMLIVCLVVWFLWAAGQVMAVEWARVPNAIAVPLALYVLAFLGLRQPAVFAPVTAPAQSAPPTLAAEPSRYRRDRLNDDEVRDGLARLHALMETEKPWLENELTLTDLAQRLSMSPHDLSQLINAHVGKSFYDYVNEHRVAEVQRCLRDPTYAKQPIIEIAFASGFNSKAAFNAAFKTQVQQTPSEYRRAAQLVPTQVAGANRRPSASARTT